SSQLEEWRIKAMSPAVDAEITSESNPLELGLQNIIADQKGCYPGQEVIEKVISLGSPAKRLCLIESRLGSGDVPPPQTGEGVFDISDSSKEVGKITSVCAGESGFWALALIRKTHVGREVTFASGVTGIAECHKRHMS